MTRPESRAGLLCLACFSGFGLVWGMYAAALPAIKSATAASDAALGLALTSIGFAALPAMAITGRLLDRYGRVVLVGSVCGFAITALLPALVGSVPALVVALLTFGVWSGAYDVSMNVTTLAVELRD